jgi:hypothetical protein
MASSDSAGFSAADLALLGTIRRHDQMLRAALCTLARRGVLLRRSQPRRAAAWLDELATHPLFKGAQFLFDLLEWEDFMLDGEAPVVLSLQSLRQVLDQVAAALRAIGAGLDLSGAPLSKHVVDPVPDPDLPALEGGFHLYRDVVLGVLWLVLVDSEG